MSSLCKTSLILLVACLGVCLFNSSAFAEDPFSKLGRGVANALTGWIEIPKNIYTTSTERNPFLGLSGGLLKGTGQAIARTGAGLYEVVTFPFPLPADYAPVTNPEYVF